LKSSF